MTGFLTPQLNGTDLTVSTMLQQPQRITKRISDLAGDQLILDKIFHTLGQRVTGGAMLYNQISIDQFFLDEDQSIEQRAPGTEYKIVKRVNPQPKMAELEDWGGKFSLPDEVYTRNDQEYLNDQVTQLTNTIVERLNTRALDALDQFAGQLANTIAGHDWMNATTRGPENTLTPGAELPFSDLSAAQMAGEMERLGASYDILLVHPQEKLSLQVCYQDRLQDMLNSAKLSMFSYPNLTPGTSWVVERGAVGVIGFEKILTTETWRDPHKRTSWVQSYAVPAMAVNQPHKAKKLVGLAG